MGIELKRYNPHGYNDGCVTMDINDNGQWCYYLEAKATISEKDFEIAKLKEEICGIDANRVALGIAQLQREKDAATIASLQARVDTDCDTVFEQNNQIATLTDQVDELEYEAQGLRNAIANSVLETATPTPDLQRMWWQAVLVALPTCIQTTSVERDGKPAAQMAIGMGNVRYAANAAVAAYQDKFGGSHE